MTLPTPLCCKRTMWDTCEATGAHQRTELTNRWATPCRWRVPCPMPDGVACVRLASVFRWFERRSRRFHCREMNTRLSQCVARRSRVFMLAHLPLIVVRQTSPPRKRFLHRAPFPPLLLSNDSSDEFCMFAQCWRLAPADRLNLNTGSMYRAA